MRAIQEGLMAKRKTKDPSYFATAAEAERGIYIDFEGGKRSPPDLIGILVDGEFRQVALTPALELAARDTGLDVELLETTVARLLDRCERQGRRIFAFTQHELRVVEKYTDLGPKMAKLYADGHKIARRWANKLHEGKPKDKDLKSFLKYIRSPMPKRLGVKTVLDKLRRIKKKTDGKDAPASIPDATRKLWKEVLQYNKHDCRGLRKVTVLATKELEDDQRT